MNNWYTFWQMKLKDWHAKLNNWHTFGTWVCRLCWHAWHVWRVISMTLRKLLQRFSGSVFYSMAILFSHLQPDLDFVWQTKHKFLCLVSEKTKIYISNEKVMREDHQPLWKNYVASCILSNEVKQVNVFQLCFINSVFFFSDRQTEDVSVFILVNN